MPLVEAEDEVQGVGVVVERSTHRSGPFPPGAFCCTPLYSTATRSVALMPVPAFPTHGSISSCCFRALWTVSATGFACDEATSAFTARCNLVCSASILPWMISRDRKSTRLNSSHLVISYAVFCLKKKNE